MTHQWKRGDGIPSQQECVRFLCLLVGFVTKPNEGRKEKGTLTKYERRCCPNGSRCQKSVEGIIKFKHNAGYSNPAEHLVSCVGKSSFDVLLQLCKQEKSRRSLKQSNIEHFANIDQNSCITIAPSEKDYQLFDYINLIIHHNQPLNIVSDSVFWNVMKRNSHAFSVKTIRPVILAMVPYVEKNIIREMKKAGYGPIMHSQMMMDQLFTVVTSVQVMPKTLMRILQ